MSFAMPPVSAADEGGTNGAGANGGGANGDKETEPVLVQSVDRALTILEVLAGQRGDVSLSDLASHLGVHKSTVFRLLGTLEAHALVEQQNERGRYRLGLGVVRLSAVANLGMDLVRLVRPASQELNAASGETVNLAVLSGSTVLYVDQLFGTAALQTHSWVGQRIPAHATSNGKVLLAFSEDPDLVPRLCAEGLERYAERTLVNPKALKADIAAVREHGWAISRDEFEDGLMAIAAPVYDAEDEVVASISVSGPSFRIEARTQELHELVLTAGMAASTRLGYRPR